MHGVVLREIKKIRYLKIAELKIAIKQKKEEQEKQKKVNHR